MKFFRQIIILNQILPQSRIPKQTHTGRGATMWGYAATAQAQPLAAHHRSVPAPLEVVLIRFLAGYPDRVLVQRTLMEASLGFHTPLEF